jgi:hypothetical protein
MPGIAFDQPSDSTSNATATTNPAIGPAMPMSNRARRERIGERIRMTAPMVPISVGIGMQKDRVAQMP